MLFNSIEYFIFFIGVFFSYWFLFQKSVKAQNILLLVSSYYFYGSWDWRFLSLIFISSITDFFIGLKLGSASNQKTRKLLLIASLCFNLGILGFFKYFNFFADSLTQLFSEFGVQPGFVTLHVILPVGVSFYTFQSLSYTLDIYKKKFEPTKDVINFLTFVAFFPQLVAGPIERAKHLLPQFTRSRIFDFHHGANGLRLILWGLFKKVAVADQLSGFVDMVYNHPAEYHGMEIIIATLFFAFQIYCDFSGYSDIAIGSAKLLGFDLMRNFNYPYFATSLKSFWQRWHISLSTWFRDYVYIPLGGNHASRSRWVFNILVTFTVSGLWHGANLTFILWGFLHGLFYLLERPFGKVPIWKHSGMVSVPATFAIVNLLWIFFRAKSMNDVGIIFTNLFNGLKWQLTEIHSLSSALSHIFPEEKSAFFLFVTLLLFLLIEWLTKSGDFNALFEKRSVIFRWSVYYFIAAWLCLFGLKETAETFIYFQF